MYAYNKNITPYNWQFLQCNLLVYMDTSTDKQFFYCRL